MHPCFGRVAGSCTRGMGHPALQQQQQQQRFVAAAATAADRPPTRLSALHNRTCTSSTSSSSSRHSSRKQRGGIPCHTTAGAGAAAEDALSDAGLVTDSQWQQSQQRPQQLQRFDPEFQQQQQSQQPHQLGPQHAAQWRQQQQQQHEERRQQQQQHLQAAAGSSQRQQQQQRQYHRSQPASLVGSSWGVAERRAHLAALVRAADSVDGLAAVWLRCRAAAGPAELTVLFNRLAAVCEPRKMSVKGWNNAKALLRELLIVSEDKMALMAGPEFVYIIAALAKLRAAPDQAWLNRWLAVSRHKLGLLSPPQLVMCVRALCRLDMQPGDVKACIAFPAWMHNLLAALRTRLPGCSGFDLAKLLRALADLGYMPARPFLAEFAAAVEPKLSSLDSINLAALMGAFSALKYEPEAAFMRAFYTEVYQKLPLFDDQDLATALCAFSSMRRLMKGDFLAEFLAEVAEKLPTFGTPALASVLGALGRLGYRPGDEWTAKVAAHLEPRLWKANVHVVSFSLWGLACCGHTPSSTFVEEFLAASMSKLGHMEAVDAVMLVQALARFGYQPEPDARGGQKGQRLWIKWWERYCHGLCQRTLHPRQVVEVLEAFRACQVVPEPQTVDHLVLQLVQGGLQHAPVDGIAHLLDMLGGTQHNPGPLFMKNYAKCIRAVSTSLKAPQLAGTLRCLAQQGYKPEDWWLVQMLALTHARVTQFDSKAAAGLLWAAAKLSRASQLPSDKWSADFAAQLWAQLGCLSAEQLVEGLWGAVAVGYRPTEEQWGALESAVALKGWQLQLQPARDAVEAFRQAKRSVPEPLLQQLQTEFERVKAVREAEVAAAEAARQQAAAALVAQQARAAAAAAAIAAHRAELQVPELAAATKGSAGAGNSKARRKRVLRAAAAAAKVGNAGGMLVLPSLGAAHGSNGHSSSPTVAAVASV